MCTERRGFSLVEILIIVVVVAVLASVVLPPLTGPARDDRPSAAEFHLGALRSVIKTYQAQHDGLLPQLDPSANQLVGLTSSTDIQGLVQSEGALGPYLTEMPLNPFTGKGGVRAARHVPPERSDITGGLQGGWLYDFETGGVWLDSDLQGEFSW